MKIRKDECEKTEERKKQKRNSNKKRNKVKRKNERKSKRAVAKYTIKKEINTRQKRYKENK